MDFHARQYDPQLGRFLSIDPLAYSGGQQVFSPYAAMGNNPGMMIDPNGETTKYAEDLTAAENDWLMNSPERKAWNLGQNTSVGVGGAAAKLLGHNVGGDMLMYAGGSGGSSDLSENQSANAFSGNNYNSGSISAIDNLVGTSNGSRSNNISTQQKVLFFKKEEEAYKYLISNSINDLESNGVPRPVENYAFITPDGVFILPTKGQDINGKDYRNYSNEAEWKVMNYIISDKGMHIESGGRWHKVLATAHTHPGGRPGSTGFYSGADEHVMELQKTMSMVLSLKSGNTYIIAPNGSGKQFQISTKDLLNGNISIRKHGNQIRNSLTR